MSEDFSKLPIPDTIKDKEVTVEIGVGHNPDHTVLDRLVDTKDIDEGKKIHVSVDEIPANLEHVKSGSVSNMTMHDFAEGDFLDGHVSTMYIFNVFGEPGSSASVMGFNERLMRGLQKKLKPGGKILIGEHMTPASADFLRDIGPLKDLGFQAERFDSHIAIDALLKQFGFSERYRNAFIGQSHENKGRLGPKQAGFLVILTRPKE